MNTDSTDLEIESHLRD